MRHVMVWVLLLAAVSIGRAETFHVTTNGQDVVTRDGRSEAAAWASLAFACEHLPAGTHTIRIGPGDFTATRTSHLPAGVTVVGNGGDGEKPTRIVASVDWKFCYRPARGLCESRGWTVAEILPQRLRESVRPR